AWRNFLRRAVGRSGPRLRALYPHFSFATSLILGLGQEIPLASGTNPGLVHKSGRIHRLPHPGNPGFEVDLQVQHANVRLVADLTVWQDLAPLNWAVVHFLCILVARLGLAIAWTEV